MRYILALVACFICSACFAASAQKKQPEKEWYFMCRKPEAGELAKGQPCWVQSRVVYISQADKTAGVLYFQVHFFSSEATLRAFIEKDDVGFLSAVVGSKKGQSQELGEMKLLQCTRKECWGDLVLSERSVEFVKSCATLGIHGWTIGGPPELSWGVHEALNLIGFTEALEELRGHVARKKS